MFARLDVAVDVAVVVEIFQNLQDLLEHRGDGDLVQDPALALLGLHLVLDDVQERADLQEPQHQPEFLLDHEAGVVHHHVLVVAALHGLRNKYILENPSRLILLMAHFSFRGTHKAAF